MAAPSARQEIDEPGNLDRCDLPELARIDSVIVMSESMSKIDDPTPTDFGMIRSKVLRHRIACLPDNLEQPLGRMLDQPLRFEGLAPQTNNLFESSSCFADIGESLKIRSAQRGTASRRMCRSRGLRPPTETTSTEIPRRAHRALSSSMTSNRELPSSNRTRRSRSLVSVSSPRAADPNTSTLEPLCARTSASISSRFERASSRIAPTSAMITAFDSDSVGDSA